MENNHLLGKERVLNAMCNKQTDRTSVHPAIDINYASRLYKKNVSECFISPEVHAKALENIFLKHHEIES